MTNNAIGILAVPEKLAARKVSLRLENGEARSFGMKDIERLLAYFNAEQSAKSVTYPAFLQIEDRTYDGFFTINREGWLQIQFAH